MVGAKYTHLLDDSDVRRWYDNLARGSEVTADLYRRRLGNFCDKHSITPRELLSLNDKELNNLVLDTVTSMESKGFSGGYIETVVKVVRSWLLYNHRDTKARIKIKGARETPTLRDERVPTRDELRQILLSGDKKGRVAAILVAHSGLRLETLGNYHGDDGLVVRDFPEMEIKGGEVSFKKTPPLVVVRSVLSKGRHQYLTFLSEEGCEYLKEYLEERMRTGEKVSSVSPIVTPKMRMKPFVRAINIGDMIRKAIRKAGFKWRPYVLRSYFDTQLMLAESKRLVLRDYRGFWMGHKGDIENRYTTNKQRLSEEVVEDMREAYRRSQEYLQTAKAERTSEERIRQDFKKQLLRVAGFGQEEVDKMDLSSISDDEFQTMVRQKLLGAMVNNGAKQKVIGIQDVERYLTNGWEYVDALPGDKAIIRVPT